MNLLNNPQVANVASLVGRAFLSFIFIKGGFSKLMGYAGAAAYMDKMGVSSMLLPLVILTELGGGLLILVGYQTRLVSVLLAGFTLLAGLLFHYVVGDANNMIHFWKNVAIAGAFLSLVANGAGAWSVDSSRTARA